MADDASLIIELTEELGKVTPVVVSAAGAAVVAAAVASPLGNAGSVYEVTWPAMVTE